MGAVDCHVHLYPETVNASPQHWARVNGEHHWEMLCTRVRKSGQPVQAFPSPEMLLKAMDAAQVERVILQGWYWESHDTCVLQNRFYADLIQRYPDRLSACATLNLRAGWERVAGELRRCVEEGFCGLGELSPHSQLYPVSSPDWDNLLAEAAALRLPVLLHVTEPQGKAYPGRVLTPLEDFVSMAERHAATTFVLAHWGARLPLDPVLGPRARALRNVYYDTAASPLLYDETVIPEMIAAVGAERVLFGSDYPLNLYPREQQEPEMLRWLETVRGAPVGEDERTDITERNTRRVFGLR